MAIIDTSVTGSFIEDRDKNSLIGIELPFYKSNGMDGYFASTTTTIKAVKQNITNLLLTEKGERYYQPELGIGLRKHLFEQVTPNTTDNIKSDIMSSFSFWLPFVNITKLDINIIYGENEFSRNSIFLDLEFSIDKMPNSLESIQLEL